MPTPRNDHEPENELMESRGEPEDRGETVERSIPGETEPGSQDTHRPPEDEKRIERFPER